MWEKEAKRSTFDCGGAFAYTGATTVSVIGVPLPLHVPGSGSRVCDRCVLCVRMHLFCALCVRSLISVPDVLAPSIYLPEVVCVEILHSPFPPPFFLYPLAFGHGREEHVLGSSFVKFIYCAFSIIV